MTSSTKDTSDIRTIYPVLAKDIEFTAALTKQYGADTDHILQEMLAGENLEGEEDFDDFISEYWDEHAVLVALFQGTGEISDEEHHSTQKMLHELNPEAAALIAQQSQKLKELGLAQNSSMLFEELEPFDIQVLECATIYIVRATEFEDHYFLTSYEAESFAKDNYEPWITKLFEELDHVQN